MAITVKCDIVSAEQEIFSSVVQSVVAPGDYGDLGIMPGHAALLTRLQPGPVRVVKENGDEEIIFVSGGFLEIQPNSITVLADTAIRAKDLDEESAQQAKEHAKEQLANQATDVDYARAKSELTEAVARLRTLQQLQNKQG